jgi:hypothetical protein
VHVEQRDYTNKTAFVRVYRAESDARV